MLKELVRRYRSPLAVIVVVAAVTGFAEAAVLVTLVPLATTIASGDDSFSGSAAGVSVTVGVGWMLLAALGFTVLRFAAQGVQSWLIAGVVSRFEHEERQELFDAFVDAEWDLQARSRGGHLQDVLTTYIQRTLVAFEQLCSSLTALVSLAAILVVALVLNPVVAVVVAASAVAIFLAVRPVSAVSARTSVAQRALSLRLAAAVSEMVLMAREVRILDASRQVKDRMAGLLTDNRRQRRRQRFLGEASSVTYQTVALLLVLGGLAVVWVAGIEDLGSLAAVVLLLLRALTYSQGFQRPYHRFREAGPFFDAIAEEKHRLHGASEPAGTDAVASISTVSFADVGYSYDEGAPEVIGDISFTARRGETIGIIGPSGAGKSTLVQLLLQLRAPSTGRILVDGQPVGPSERAGVRRRIGYVPQEPLLLNASVEENIRFFRPGVDRRAVEHAARLAHVHDDVETFPQGYDTEVGERGSAVSGGQRQRICIARALVSLPDVLVLDEPTSALDGRSEALVQETIDDLKGSMLVVIVAHRLSTLAGCDRVMVLEGGRLTAFDAPHALRGTSAYFDAAMAQAQVASPP